MIQDELQQRATVDDGPRDLVVSRGEMFLCRHDRRHQGLCLGKGVVRVDCVLGGNENLTPAVIAESIVRSWFLIADIATVEIGHHVLAGHVRAKSANYSLLVPSLQKAEALSSAPHLW